MRQTAVKFGVLATALLLFAAGYLVLVAANDHDGYDYTIQVSGTPGLKITGNCVVDTASGSVVKDFTGPADRVEHVTGTGVRCHLHKEQDDGSLRLTISQNGNVVSESESSGGSSDIDASVSVS